MYIHTQTYRDQRNRTHSYANDMNDMKLAYLLLFSIGFVWKTVNCVSDTFMLAKHLTCLKSSTQNFQTLFYFIRISRESVDMLFVACNNLKFFDSLKVFRIYAYKTLDLIINWIYFLFDECILNFFLFCFFFQQIWNKHLYFIYISFAYMNINVVSLKV